MQSLIGVALSLLPRLIELVAEDKSNALAVQASDLVASTVGADEETIVCQRLLDPACARTVTVRLAELALTAQRSWSAITEAADQLMREDIKSTQRQLAALIAHSSVVSREGLPPRRGFAATQLATPAHSNFLPCLHEVLRLEGGYSDDPRDPGGPTNFGITRAEWASVCKVPISSITPEDMQSLTLSEAASVYRKFYWNAMCCENMARGVDLMVFQFGVNAGTDTSAQVLQQICGVTTDGIIGPITLAAACRVVPVTLINRLAKQQIESYQGFSEWDEFGAGWVNRVRNAQTVALSMAEVTWSGGVRPRIWRRRRGADPARFITWAYSYHR